MRIEEYFQTGLHEQQRIIRRGRPAKARQECAKLAAVTPTKLGRILGITGQPKRRYTTRAGERIRRVVDLRREVGQWPGENRANEFSKKPKADLNGKTLLDLTRWWIGAWALREMPDKPAHSTKAENDALRRHLAKSHEVFGSH